MIIDKLYNRIKERSFVCVGLDTALDYIPLNMQEGKSIEDAIFNFNKEIIDSTCDLVAIYKLQIAHYESQGIDGLKAYKRTLKYLRDRDLLSIGDIKRGDISSTAKMYAKGHFEGDFEADFITLNPYMGFDSISPYFPYLESGKKGVFVLLRTSNEGAKDIEYLDVNGDYLYNKVGEKLEEFGKSFIGECGLSALGMVVGGTHSEEAKEIRDKFNNTMFLIPGYGAQGAKPEDIRTYLENLDKGVVNSSRGIITHYKKFEDGNENVGKYARQAVVEMIGDISGK